MILLQKHWRGIAASICAAAAAHAVTFEADVRPIFEKRCAGCHSPGANRLKADLDLSTLENTLAGGENGPAVISGDAPKSILVQMIEHTLEPHMPPPDKGDKLPDAEIAVIRQWIAEGAQGGATPVVASKVVAPVNADGAPISAVAFSPAAGSLRLAEGTLHAVRLYTVNAATGARTEEAVLEGHAEMVRALAFSPDGALLAAAGGAPGRGGEVVLWDVALKTEVRRIVGHHDNILGVAFSPDGSTLATCSYDRTIILWDVATGESKHLLKDHVDAVYAVAFSPDGKYLASGAGDRTVKVWDVATGLMKVTISDSLDIVYTLAFSPDGRYLAGGGGDKILRVWDPGLTGALRQGETSGGVLVGSTFAHEGAILSLVYSHDGATLYTSGEDRRIKAWHAAELTEQFVLGGQPDWANALALSPDDAVLAVGRFDASDALYAATTGLPLGQNAVASDTGSKKVTSLDVEAVVIEATVPPSITSAAPTMLVRGTEVELTVQGKNLDRAAPVLSNPGLTATLKESTALPIPDAKVGAGPRGTGADVFDNAQPYTLRLVLTVAPDAPVGYHEIMFRTPLGMTNASGLQVVARNDTAEAEPNPTREIAQAIAWPGIVSGATNESGDVDVFRVDAKAGQDIVAVVADTALNISLRLLNESGDEIAAGDAFHSARHDRLGYRVPTDGRYYLEVADLDLRANVGYRLHVGAFPMATRVWPLGISAGTTDSVSVEGFNLGATELAVSAPAEAVYDTTIPLPIAGVEGSPVALPALAVSPWGEFTEAEPNDLPEQAMTLPAPGSVSAQLAEGDDGDLYRVALQAGQRVYLETMAARLGSPVDTVVDVLDAEGKPLRRGDIRCIAETFLTLSPRDSKSGGMRLDAWRDMAVADYLLVGSELVKISRLPDYADEDASLETYASGQRIGYFGTTPEHHAVNTRIYKVEIHPPGSELAPNGKPVFPLWWRNDDGFFGNGTSNGDSQLEFTAPADGAYLVRVSDVMGRQGPEFTYRLMVREPVPDYDVVAGPYRVNVAPGGRVPVEVRVRRKDGFDEAVTVALHDLPEGFHAEPDIILPGEDSVKLALVADASAASTPLDATFRVSAESVLNGEPTTREARLGAITVSEVQPDLVVQNEETQLALAPESSGWIGIRLDRFNGFNSRVPIDVLNLPVGVRVLDTGLNGILVREGESERRMELYAEPWAEPITRTIYVQARIETLSPQQPVFLSEPITLTVGGPALAAKAR